MRDIEERVGSECPPYPFPTAGTHGNGCVRYGYAGGAFCLPLSGCLKTD